jgi:hypothetical protein
MVVTGNRAVSTQGTHSEAIAIPIVVPVLARQHHPEYIMPAISAIVGVHFVGMAKAFHTPRYFWICLVLVLLSAGTVVFLPLHSGAHSIQLWTVVVGWGCAAVLWADSLLNLWRTHAFLVTHNA